MGKVEWNNTIQLLRIRNKESKVVKVICILLIALFGIDLIVIQKVMEHSAELETVSYQTYSVWAFVLVIISIILISANYREYNRKIQIYPQSNKSRFVSYVLFCYLTLFKVLLFSVFIYLIQYGIFKILTVIYENVELVYEFNIPFILAGFLVNSIYGLLILSLIILFGVLDRKYRILFRIAAVGVFLLVYISYLSRYYILNGFIRFFIGESSIILFTIKGTIILLILVALSLYINEKTKYYHIDKGFIFSKAIIGISIGFVMYFVISYLSFSNTNMETSIVEVKEPRISYGRSANKEYRYQVDVSHLPDGTTITLNLSNNLENQYPLFYDNQAANFTKKQIEIDFDPRTKWIDWVDLNQFIEPELEVSLDGNNLNIDLVSKENVKIVFISPFSYMWQFDYFKGKQIFKENAGSMSGNGGGNISIYLPEAINLKVME
jgi:hypothetical protein